jgi:predicted glycoside hydrolase/deacetylase ChbG (UPF0249 family)
VNAHKHFHLHPTLLAMLLQIGREYGLRMAGIRVPAQPLWTSHAAALLAPWAAIMKHRLRSAGIVCNDHIFGMAESGRMDEPRLLRILTHLPQGVSEIYLHPATQSGGCIAPSMVGYRHADELAALMSSQVRAAIATLTAADVECGGFSDLARAGWQRHAA